MTTLLSGLASALMLGGIVLVFYALFAMVGAWRNGIPWWSGGMVWFSPGLQPPAARPHIRSAWRRFGLAALCTFAGTLIMAAIQQPPAVP